MAQHYAQPWIRTTVCISPEFYKLCKEHHIKFSDAMRTGISITLAEKGVKEYDNDLNIVRRVQELKQKAAAYAQKAADIESKEQDAKP